MASLVVDLSGIEPSPDRLLEIAAGFRANVSEAVIVDWGGRFPWSKGLVRWGFETAPESLVLETMRRLGSNGGLVALAIPRLPPADSRTGGGAEHLRRAAAGRSAEWAHALEAYTRDLIEDALELAPDLGAIAVHPSASFGASVRAAAQESGLRVLTLPEITGEAYHSIEHDLAQRGHSLSKGTAILDLHRTVAELRQSGWDTVADLHELVADIPFGANRGLGADQAAGALRSLGRVIRELEAQTEAAAMAYEGLAVTGAPKRELRRLIAPLREQHAMLGSRLSVLRSAT